MKYVLSQNPCLFSLTIDLNSVMVRDFSLKCLAAWLPTGSETVCFFRSEQIILTDYHFCKSA